MRFRGKYPSDGTLLLVRNTVKEAVSFLKCFLVSDYLPHMLSHYSLLTTR